MTFKPAFDNLHFVLITYKIFGFLSFLISHLNHETFKLCLQNTLNMSKTTRVYFGALHQSFELRAVHISADD